MFFSLKVSNFPVQFSLYKRRGNVLPLHSAPFPGSGASTYARAIQSGKEDVLLFTQRERAGERMKALSHLADCYLLFLLAVPSCLVCSIETLLDEGHVVVLDATNFSETIGTHSFVVVEFYASWCGFCKKLAPEYEKAAAILKGHEPPILLAKVDAEEQRNKVLARKYGIRGFPTLKIFEGKRGAVRDYKGPREADGIVSYLMKEAGPPSEEIVSLKQGEMLRNEADVVVVGVFSTYDSKEFADFMTTASELRSDYQFKHTLDPNFIPSKDAVLKGPMIRVLKKFDEEFNDFKEFSLEAVREFLGEVSIPSVVFFNKDPSQLRYLSKIFANSRISKVFLFVSSNDGGTAKIKAFFTELASEYKGKGLKFMIADSENGQKAIEHFGLTKSKLPSILIQGKDEAVHVLEDAKTEEIRSWLEDYLNGKLSPRQQPESVQEKKAKTIMVAVGDTFEALVLKSLKNGHVFVEALLVVVIVYLLLQKSYQPEKRPLTTQEIDQLCDEWSPEPLHPPVSAEMEMEAPLLESAAGPRAIVNGEEVINLTSANYLGLMGDKRIVDACTTTLERYGVGACGPRGFYGTIDVHLDCELKISEFMGTPDCILYSYGLATAASTIPAFCKRGDLILADEGVSWGIQNGLSLSRSTVRLFKHNDMSSLESLLEAVHKEDQQKRKALVRRFIVVEAIYQNSGQMAPLLDLVRLKEKYRFRLLLDESNSIGVLGEKGRGLTEHFKVPVEKVDIITAAMGHALASVGGFCTGSAKVVDHQRLSSAGYCFSASLPPYVASATITAISILQENAGLVSKLQQNVTVLRKALADIPGLVINSHPMSPLIFMQLKSSTGSFKEDSRVLQKIFEQLLNKESVLVSMTRRSVLDKCKLPTALRLAVSVGHAEADLLAAAVSIKKVAASIFESDCNGQYEFIK
ncbi:hypothetical protein GOP47_0019587 [Adiantum capillus-veneris]|uniref:serine C-palmitoyltransferase n=1 Tax=Adiantum capillus-veneris TaxID=13818 RepID=A0A9D4UBS2_ADICA|nr:hypothetical protein GOP47_0019587 [Adiantum capillus-veneris]